MFKYKKPTPRMYIHDRMKFNKFTTMNYFVLAVHCRLPYQVSTNSLYNVNLQFAYGGHDYLLQLSLDEYVNIINYAYSHIDDIL